MPDQRWPLPPFGKELIARLQSASPPWPIVICFGRNAWQRARQWQSNPTVATSQCVAAIRRAVWRQPLYQNRRSQPAAQRAFRLLAPNRTRPAMVVQYGRFQKGNWPCRSGIGSQIAVRPGHPEIRPQSEKACHPGQSPRRLGLVLRDSV